MKSLTRSVLLVCLMIPALTLADDAPPRLINLAPPLAADFSAPRHVTPLGQYAASQVMQVQFKAGTEIPPHSIPVRALAIVISGRGHFDFNGEIVPLHERQVLHMLPDEMRAVVAETDLELLVVRLPPEE